jgi:hypothetical protein
MAIHGLTTSWSIKDYFYARYGNIFYMILKGSNHEQPPVQPGVMRGNERFHDGEAVELFGMHWITNPEK